MDVGRCVSVGFRSIGPLVCPGVTRPRQKPHLSAAIAFCSAGISPKYRSRLPSLVGLKTHHLTDSTLRIGVKSPPFSAGTLAFGDTLPDEAKAKRP